MERQEISTQMGVSRVESRTSHRLTPFTEMAKWISGEVIQGTFDGELLAATGRGRSAAPGSSEMTNVASDETSAQERLLGARRRGISRARKKANSGDREQTAEQVHRRPPAMPSATITRTEPNSTQVA